MAQIAVPTFDPGVIVTEPIQGTVAEADTAHVDGVIEDVAQAHDDSPDPSSVAEADTSATDEAAEAGAQEQQVQTEGQPSDQQVGQEQVQGEQSPPDQPTQQANE